MSKWKVNRSIMHSYKRQRKGGEKWGDGEERGGGEGRRSGKEEREDGEGRRKEEEEKEKQEGWRRGEEEGSFPNCPRSFCYFC